MPVFRVFFKVACELLYAARSYGDLNFGRTSILLVELVSFYDIFFFLRCIHAWVQITSFETLCKEVFVSGCFVKQRAFLFKTYVVRQSM